MARKTSSIAWWAGLAATAAGFVLTAASAQAQTARDPLELEPANPETFRTEAFRVERRPAARSLTISPRVGVRTLVTDNVYLTPTDHKVDLITNPFVGVSIRQAGPRSAGALDFDVGYDSYSRAHQLNGWSYVGYGTGQYDVVQRLLTLESVGSIVNGNVSSFGSPVIDRSGIQGRTQITNLAFGPRLTTTIGDVVDLNAVARVRWVGYHAENTTLTSAPQDSTIREVTGAVTTGDRYASHEIRASATYQADDNDFRLYSGLASVFVPVSPNLRVLARGGADNIRQPRVVDIQAPIWSVGFEYQINPTSYVRLEGGRRYHDTTFAAESRIDMTDRFYLVGSYQERILPAQISLNDSFLGFVSNSQTLPAPLADSSFGVLGSLFNETSKDKLADIRAVYTWPDQEVALTASWIRRHLLASDTFDESLYATATYSRRMRPDLRTELSVTYGHEVGDNIGSGSSRKWEGSASLIYILNPTVEIVGGYAYSNDSQTGGGGPRLIENVLFASLVKSF